MHRTLIAMLALTATLAAQPVTGSATLAVAGRANATPSIAAVGDFVVVAWGATLPGTGADVFIATSQNGGASFGAPVRVNVIEGSARLGGELPPRIALVRRSLGTPEIVVAWGAKSQTTSIRLARSTDGGRTFGDERSIQGSEVAGDRGWHALTVDDEGTPHVVWLDHRKLAARPRASEHDHHADGAAMAQSSSLYYARVGPQAAIGERDLLTGVCYCCKTALLTGPGGSLFTAWRHVYPGNIRDIAFTQSRDGGKTFQPPTRVSEDQWQLAGCPDDGPAMARSEDGTIHLVWPTVIGGPEPTGALFYASTRDGTTFTPRQRVPTLGSPKPGHPQIAIDGAGKLVLAWDEVLNGVRQAAVVTATRAASQSLTFGTTHRLAQDGTSLYPVMANTNRGLVIAWTSGTGTSSRIAVRRF